MRAARASSPGRGAQGLLFGRWGGGGQGPTAGKSTHNTPGPICCSLVVVATTNVPATEPLRRLQAAVIWHNFNHGRRRALWLSVSADLIDDARRDLDDIGAGSIPCLDLRDYPADAVATRKCFPRHLSILMRDRLASGLYKKSPILEKCARRHRLCFERRLGISC